MANIHQIQNHDNPIQQDAQAPQNPAIDAANPEQPRAAPQTEANPQPEDETIGLRTVRRKRPRADLDQTPDYPSRIDSPRRAVEESNRAAAQHKQYLLAVMDGAVPCDAQPYKIAEEILHLFNSPLESENILGKMRPLISQPNHPLFPLAIAVTLVMKPLTESYESKQIISQIHLLFQTRISHTLDHKNKIALLLLNLPYADLKTLITHYNQTAKAVFNHVQTHILSQENHPLYKECFFLYGALCFNPDLKPLIEGQDPTKQDEKTLTILDLSVLKRVQQEMTEISQDLSHPDCARASYAILKHRMDKETLLEESDGMTKSAIEHLLAHVSSQSTGENALDPFLISHFICFYIAHLQRTTPPNPHDRDEHPMEILREPCLSLYRHYKDQFANTEHPGYLISMLYIGFMKILHRLTDSFGVFDEKVAAELLQDKRAFVEYSANQPKRLINSLMRQDFFSAYDENLIWHSFFDQFKDKQDDLRDFLNALPSPERNFLIVKMIEIQKKEALLPFVNDIIESLEDLKSQSEKTSTEPSQKDIDTFHQSMAKLKASGVLAEISEQHLLDRISALYVYFQKTENQVMQKIIQTYFVQPSFQIYRESDPIFTELNSFENPGQPRVQRAINIAKLKQTDPCDLSNQRALLLSQELLESIETQNRTNIANPACGSYLSDLLFLKTMNPDLAIAPQIHNHALFIFSRLSAHTEVSHLDIPLATYFSDLLSQGTDLAYREEIAQFLNAMTQKIKRTLADLKNAQDSPYIRQKNLECLLYLLRRHYQLHDNLSSPECLVYLSLLHEIAQKKRQNNQKLDLNSKLTLLAPQKRAFLRKMHETPIPNINKTSYIYGFLVAELPYNYVSTYLDKYPLSNDLTGLALKSLFINTDRIFEEKYSSDIYHLIITDQMSSDISLKFSMNLYEKLKNQPERLQALKEKMKTLLIKILETGKIDIAIFQPHKYSRDLLLLIIETSNENLNHLHSTCLLMLIYTKFMTPNENSAFLINCIRENLNKIDDSDLIYYCLALFLDQMPPQLYKEAISLIIEFSHKLFEQDKSQPLHLDHLRVIAPREFPTLEWPHQNVATRFQSLINQINFVDEKSPNYYAIQAVVANDQMEFDRSEYAKMSLTEATQKVTVTVMRFLKTLINTQIQSENAKEPDATKHQSLLALTAEEQKGKTPWLPSKELIPEWINLLKHMIEALEKITDPYLFRVNLGILMKALTICPTGQDAGFNTAVKSLLLGYNQIDGTFESTVNAVVHDVMNTALIQAVNCSEDNHRCYKDEAYNNKSLILVHGAHRSALFEFVLRDLFGFPKLTSFQEDISRFSHFSQIQRILVTFEKHFTPRLLVERLLKHFRTNEDLKLLPNYAHAEGDQSRQLSSAQIKAAQSERPLKIFEGDEALDGYYGWLVNNQLNPAEYGVHYDYDEESDTDKVRIEITRDHVLAVLKKLGFVKQDVVINWEKTPHAS
jgi:hypothetical protein